MPARYLDALDPLKPSRWLGHDIVITEQPRPYLKVTACEPSCLRIALGDDPKLWSRIDDDFWGYWVLRTSSTASPDILSPIAFGSIPADPDKRHWSREFCRELISSPKTPLHDGKWTLRHDSDRLRANTVEAIVRQRPYGYVEWDFGDHPYPFPLRTFSRHDDGRVKAWRKHVRRGTLPPVLLLWVSGLQAHVVLDGHDRLLACKLEQADAPVLVLTRVEVTPPDSALQEAVVKQVELSLELANAHRARPAHECLARVQRFLSVDEANVLLLRAFSPRTRETQTAAFRLPGGLSQWLSEVESTLSSGEEAPELISEPRRRLQEANGA